MHDELRKILEKLGYKENNNRKTADSLVAFYNEETKHIILLHKPHPKNVLKQYQLQ